MSVLCRVLSFLFVHVVFYGGSTWWVWLKDSVGLFSDSAVDEIAVSLVCFGASKFFLLDNLRRLLSDASHFFPCVLF